MSTESQQDAPAKSEESSSSYRLAIGTDSEGREYYSIQEMWTAQGIYSDQRDEVWYGKAAEYYEANCPATIDGVLGGFANISDCDLAASRRFVDKIKQLRSPEFEWSQGAACECGAGIGRVSKGLLLPLGVPRCDLIESSSRLLSAAPEHIGDAASRCRFYCTGLQDWNPSKQNYSIIWIQWVGCYLTDEDFVSLLKRCGESLVPGGVICLKENTCSGTTFVVDVDDASVTRSVHYLQKLVEDAGLRVIHQELQDDFPEEIYPVPMFALDVAPSET